MSINTTEQAGIDLDLDKLEALARAATPGPWFGQAVVGYRGNLFDVRAQHQRSIAGSIHAPDDATYIAAFNPATVLQLIALARPSHSGGQADEPIELVGVREEIAAGSGFWSSCSGCHDTEDGHPTGPYSYSRVFGCALGSGCSECGGIGAVWDNTDYAEMAHEGDEDSAQQAPAAQAVDARPMGWVQFIDGQQTQNFARDDAELATVKEMAALLVKPSSKVEYVQVFDRPAPASAQGAAHADDLAVERFAAEMRVKMAKARAKGRGGWDDPAVCSAARLQIMLVEHLPKGDPVDIGNFAMMLWNRGEPVAAPRQAFANDGREPDWDGYADAELGAEERERRAGYREGVRAAADLVESAGERMIAARVRDLQSRAPVTAQAQQAAAPGDPFGTQQQAQWFERLCAARVAEQPAPGAVTIWLCDLVAAVAELLQLRAYREHLQAKEARKAGSEGESHA